jgi:hypothetical protein
MTDMRELAAEASVRANNRVGKSNQRSVEGLHRRKEDLEREVAEAV